MASGEWWCRGKQRVHLLLAQRVEVCNTQTAATPLETLQVLSRQLVTLQRKLRDRRKQAGGQ